LKHGVNIKQARDENKKTPPCEGARKFPLYHPT
jgi:hypothetical protein